MVVDNRHKNRSESQYLREIYSK